MTTDGNVIVTPWAPSAEELAESTSVELVHAGQLQNALEIFTKGGMKSLLDGIEAKVRSMKLDVSTFAGRAEIRSVAYQIARTKTTLDGEGKQLTEDWRKATALVNTERRACQERLDALKEEIRKPLTDFEQREAARIAGHERALKELATPAAIATGNGLTSEQLAILLVENATLHAERNWEEFDCRATTTRAQVRSVLHQQLEARQRWEGEQAELARLRQEEEDRRQRERDERIAAEAAEKARIAAERAAAEAAAVERRRVEQEAAKVAQEAADRLASAERERKAAEQQAAAKLAAAEKARKLAEERAAVEREEAAQREAAAAQKLKDTQLQAKRDSEAAAQRERNRIEAARREEEAEQKIRESDEARRNAVRADIIDAISPFIPDLRLAAGDIADAIMDGKIPNVKVLF